MRTLPCRQGARLPVGRWALLYWDHVAGWEIARTAKTRRDVMRGWRHGRLM